MLSCAKIGDTQFGHGVTMVQSWFKEEYFSKLVKGLEMNNHLTKNFEF